MDGHGTPPALSDPTVSEIDEASTRNATLVAIGIFLSRIAGLVRERALGHFLGTGVAMEAFRAALRIPNLLQNLLGEGVLSAAFIPEHAKLRNEEAGEEPAARLAGAVAALLVLVAGGLTLVGTLFARPLASVIAVGWTGERLELTVTLVRILTPAMGALVLSAWCLGVLNSHRRFFLPYVAPVLWNAAIVAAAVTAGLAGWTTTSIAVAVAWGTFVGGLAQFLVQLPSVLVLSPGAGAGFRAGLRGAGSSVRGLGAVVRGTAPVILGRGVVQILAYVQLVLASLLAAGAVAAMSFAQVLFVLPVSLFGMSVAAAELPELAADASGRIKDRMRSGLDRMTFYVAFTTLMFIVLGDRIVAALYQSGQFTALDARHVWIVLIVLAVGLIPTTWSRLLQSLLYAQGNTSTPARIAAGRVLVSVAVGFAVMGILDGMAVTPTGVEMVGDASLFTVTDPALRNADQSLLRLGAAGLAFGTTVSAWMELLLLRRALATSGAAPALATAERTRTFMALLPLLLVAALTRSFTASLGPLVAGAVAIGTCGLAWIAITHVAGVEESKRLVASVGRTIRR